VVCVDGGFAVCAQSGAGGVIKGQVESYHIVDCSESGVRTMSVRCLLNREQVVTSPESTENEIARQLSKQFAKQSLSELAVATVATKAAVVAVFVKA
jgi:hypothetical protein